MWHYWSLFGLPEGAAPRELHARYRQLVKECHPDRFATDERQRVIAEARLKLINEAYRVLRTGARHPRQRPPSSPAAPAPRSAPPPDYGLGWLQSKWTLTYLPLTVVVLFVETCEFDALLPLRNAAAAALVMAWALMAWSVWHNETHQRSDRILWIVAMMLVAFVAVPAYFEVERDENGVV